MRGEGMRATEVREGRQVRLTEVKTFDVSKDQSGKEAVRPGRVERFAYDANGRLARYEWSYERRGTRSKNEKDGPKENKITREFAYDSQGRRVKELMLVDAHSDYGPILHEGERTFRYEGDSKNPTFETYEKDGNVSETVENAYDDVGRLARRYTVSYIMGKSERVEEFDYDAHGRVAERRQIDTESTGLFHSDTPYSTAFFFRNKYDDRGRIISEERGHVGAGQPFGIVEYEYSPDGRVVTEVNFFGREKIWEMTRRLDEHEKLAELIHTSFKSGKKDFTSTTRYENTYEDIL